MRIEKLPFKAVIFDLDGVITQTSLVHSSAWKKMFDEFLITYSKTNNLPFKEFTSEDYLKYVDGKPRYDGVQSFLKSRNINLPYGNVNDLPDKETVCGLGNKKNEFFNFVLENEGVKTYPSTISFINELKENNIKIGVASSSKNCKAVLETAKINQLFLTRVDGVISAEMGLKGKPEPDIFLQATENVKALPHETIVVEDATSGVEAGRKGGFGLVIGLARENNHVELWNHGADIVVSDLEELDLDKIIKWFTSDKEKDSWKITYHDYNPVKEKSRESMLTTGNGYMGIRGCLEEQTDNKINYPATYIASLYNKLPTQIQDRTIWNEDFVNVPNGLSVNFKVNDSEVFDINNSKLIDIKRTLNLNSGLLEKVITVQLPDGSLIKIVSEKFVSMKNPNLAAINYSVIPLDSDKKITLISKFNADIINNGVDRYKTLNQKHLKPLNVSYEDNLILAQSVTAQSEVIVAQAMSHNISINNEEKTLIPNIIKQDSSISLEYSAKVEKNSKISLTKIMLICTSLNYDNPEPFDFVKNNIKNNYSFKTLLEESAFAWNKLWNKMDIKVEYDRFSQKMLRLNMYHLLVSMSQNNRKIDASITARGLHGEAYRGHIFWDEIFIIPFYNIHFPEIARSMLLYRYRRLNAARDNALKAGYKGAMFPWQSGSDGSEQTQIVHLNPISGEWGDDNSSLQRHVNLAIAFNIWQYVHVTNDIDFLRKYGLEMFLEICRFWESKCTWNETRKKYDISNVMGPDEFHEKYPDAEKGGITNNAYTNIFVAWLFEKSSELINISQNYSAEVFEKINLKAEEREKWDDIEANLFLDISNDGIIAQYEGYFNLKEIDFDFYKQKYGNIYRMDRILKAEGLSPDDYKVSKQADLIMLFYLFSKSEIVEILNKMNYNLSEDFLEKNFDYYIKRTSHGSTLSRIVHSKIASQIGYNQLSWELYSEALQSDYNDIQGGTTAEGIHAGVMAGTIMVALNTYAGLDIHKNSPEIIPNLPKKWNKMKFNISFESEHFSVDINDKEANIIRIV